MDGYLWVVGSIENLTVIVIIEQVVVVEYI